MWKVLFAVVVLAVPIFCGPIDGGKKKTSFQRIVEEAWREKCKNVSGVAIDSMKYDHLYLEFEDCKKTAVDYDELRQDAMSIFPNLSFGTIGDFHISGQQKIDLVAMSRNYCPKADALYGCRDIMDPIMNDCLDAEELEGQKVEMEISRRLNNYFCKNESFEVKRFIDGKVIECGLEKKDEAIECYQEYTLSLMHFSQPISFFSSMLKADNFCSSIDILRRCLVPVLKQCELSETAGTIAESQFADILTETACVDHINN